MADTTDEIEPLPASRWFSDVETFACACVLARIYSQPMKMISGIPVTDRHANSRVGITRAKSALTLIEAAKLIVENDDISAMEEDKLNMPMSVAFMASCWDISPEYARKLVLDVKSARR